MKICRKTLTRLVSMASLVAMTACGGGGSDDAGANVPVPDALVGGIWAGTVTDNVFNEPQFFLGVSTDDGRFRFLSAESLGQFVGAFSVNGTSLTGGGIGVAPFGSVWLNDRPVIDVSLTGTISERSRMFGDWTGSTGEIDILEMYGARDNGVVEANIHYEGPPGRHASMGSVATKLPEGWFADNFHVFELEWDETTLKWFVDGEQYASTAITGDQFTEFHHPFFMLLNIALGGRAAGPVNDDTPLPVYMYVDWVRVYQQDSSAE